MEPRTLRWRWGRVAVSAEPGSWRPDKHQSPPPAPALPITQSRADPSIAVVETEYRHFDDFYRAHRDEIGRALAFTLGGASLGQEAVDEAMARACQRWDQLASTENPAGWVYVVGRRWGLSWRRSRTRERKREQLVAESDQLSDPSLSDPAHSNYTDLMNALATLSADQRTAVVCRFSLGMSVRETATLLDISEGTVKSRVSRSLEQLRTLIEVYE